MPRRRPIPPPIPGDLYVSVGGLPYGVRVVGVADDKVRLQVVGDSRDDGRQFDVSLPFFQRKSRWRKVGDA